MEQKIKTILVTHKDRFGRFGYDWFKKFCMNAFKLKVLVISVITSISWSTICFQNPLSIPTLQRFNRDT